MSNNRKSRARLIHECYLDMKNDRSFSKYSKVVRESALARIQEEFRQKFGDESYNELMSEIEADKQRIGNIVK